jgi:hypothetical protein
MRSFSKRFVACATAAAVVLVSGAVLADITIPNKFVAGGTIKSADVNANFDALNTGKQDKVTVFTHVATATSINMNSTVIDNPATNGAPNATLIITPNRSPGGVAAAFYYGSVSVNYGNGKWQIIHDKGPTEPVQVNEAFNVVVYK